MKPGSSDMVLPESELFRVIAEFTYDWETWVDAEGKPRWINAAVERITGFSVAECLALPDYPLPLVHPEDRAIVGAILRDAEQRGSGNDVEFRVLRKDGQTRWVAISWQSLTDSSDKRAGYRSSVRDIDERKHMEQELRNMRKRAESAVVARSELLANVSHELRSPAHCIAGFAELLEASELEASQRRYVALIREQCVALQRQVDDLLHLAALEAGGLTLEREPVDLVALARSLLEASEPRAQHKGLALTLEGAPPSCWVEADAARIGQILRNLLDNAIKFTERGRVSLSLTCVPKERDVALVQFKVADTGVGMNVEEARRVLAPFEQADGSTRRRHGGVGLGLAIAHRLATYMGGRLEIASAVGAGTTILVDLPLSRVDAPKSEAANRSSGKAPVVRSGRALIVDDSAPARELLRAMLELNGWQAEEAESGSEAQQRLAERGFDLVLLDYQMPDADGAETAIQLKRLSQTRRHTRPMPIYLLTANLFAHQQLEQLGAIDRVLAKPLSRATLLALLSELDSDAPDSGREERASHSTASDVQARLDQEVLDDLRALTGRDGTPVLPRVIESTRLAQAQSLADLRQAVAAHDLTNAARAAHGVAGQAAMVGARFVADLARTLQSALEEGSLSASEYLSQVEGLERAWTLAEQALLEQLR